MSRWLDRVAAVVDVWYPGEEGGRGIADVLLGDANPAGRLPVTFPVSEGRRETSIPIGIVQLQMLDLHLS